MIYLENVSYRIKEKKILENITYHFACGVYILQGESGIGKTTLLNLLCGYLKPDKGKIKKKTKLKIGYMFQEDMLFHNLTVRENFNIKCNAMELEEGNREKIIDKYCKQFKITNKLDCRVSSLSGGEKKRVQMVMLAMDDCDVWLLDEPIANLDMDNSNIIIQYLFGLKNKVVFIVSHQFIQERDNSFTLLEMKDGRLYEKK
ncbi:MAG: ATP-binding cassette domain-containing protein [Lachnospiraceae bacterium]|nr:ATP-binding cassette domain-containing protein [Lachnospiraceae bacterium]